MMWELHNYDDDKQTINGVFQAMGKINNRLLVNFNVMCSTEFELFDLFITRILSQMNMNIFEMVIFTYAGNINHNQVRASVTPWLLLLLLYHMNKLNVGFIN